jgi:hypothetical protein
MEREEFEERRKDYEKSAIAEFYFKVWSYSL